MRLFWNEMKEIDAKRRDIFSQSRKSQAERNTVSAEIAQAKRNKENADDKIGDANPLCRSQAQIQNWLKSIAKLTEFTITLPNIPADSVPVGADEDDNVEVL